MSFTHQINELCFVKLSYIWLNFTFPSRLGKIKIKDRLSPDKAETGAELVNFSEVVANYKIICILLLKENDNKRKLDWFDLISQPYCVETEVNLNQISLASFEVKRYCIFKCIHKATWFRGSTVKKTRSADLKLS